MQIFCNSTFIICNLNVFTIYNLSVQFKILISRNEDVNADVATLCSIELNNAGRKIEFAQNLPGANLLKI